MLDVPPPTDRVLPLTVNELVEATVKLFAAPLLPVLRVGFFPLTLIFTSSLLSGTCPRLQFPGVFQSVVAPVNWLSTAIAGAAPAPRATATAVIANPALRLT
jgi:hypothetical protein